MEDREITLKDGATNNRVSNAHLGLSDGNDDQSSVCGRMAPVKEESKMGQKEIVGAEMRGFYTTPEQPLLANARRSW